MCNYIFDIHTLSFFDALMSKNNLIDNSNIWNLAKCCTKQSFYKERRVFFGILSTTFPSMTHDDKSISNIGCAVEILLLLSTAEPQHGTMRVAKRRKKHWPLPQVFMWTYCIYIGTGYAGQLVPRFPLFVPFGGWSLVTLAFAAKHIC